MNEQSDFERFVADQLGSAAVGTPPEAAIQDTIARARGSRRLPEWLALIKEPPMRSNSRTAVGSPTMRVAAILVATLLAAVMLVGATFAGAQLLAADGSIVVDQDGNGNYATIAEAIAAAGAGDEILIRPGTYIEALVIDKDIALTGDGPVEDIVITAPDGGPEHDTRFSYMGHAPFAILLSDADARLSGLTLRGTSSRLFADGGAPVIESVVFDGVGEEYTGSAVVAAMVVNGGSSATVRHNSFARGGGIDVFEGSEPVIDGNDFIAGSGIFGVFGDAAIIRNNDLMGPGAYGISFWAPTAMLVAGNAITGTEDGIRGVRGTPTIRDNVVSDTTLTAITVGADGEPSISGNSLANNSIAIGWSGGAGLVEQNEITGGQAGIVITRGSPIMRDNTVDGVEGRAFEVTRGASPTLSGNTSCGNGENLVVADEATPDIDDTNEICEDDAA